MRLNDNERALILTALCNQAEDCRDAASKLLPSSHDHQVFMESADVYSKLAVKIEDAEEVIA